jgi:C-terminal processing protease CtpA/Prc
MRSIAEAMRRPHDAELVPLGPPLASTVPASEVLAQPARVGILIDGSCSSSAENFLLAARQSKKVTLFGARTFGAMDFQNVRMAPLPSGKRQLMFGMTMSTRLDDQAAEPERGIAPEVPLDVRILRDADRGVDHALTSLRRSAGD